MYEELTGSLNQFLLSFQSVKEIPRLERNFVDVYSLIPADYFVLILNMSGGRIKNC